MFIYKCPCWTDPLYITVILGYVPCKDIKALSAVYGVIIAFYFGSRAIESSVIKLKR